jgi:uncharacterized protein (TIGR02466 family)
LSSHDAPEVSLLQAAGKLGDQQVDTILREALANISRREFVLAERLLDVVFSSRPDDPNALYVLAQLRHLQGRLPEAQGLYRRSLAIDSAHPETHFHLGQALTLSGELDDAIASFKESIRLRPESAEAHFELGMTLSRKQDFSAAERAYREALRLAPNLLPARHALSTTLVSLGRPKDAEAVGRGALQQAANDARWFAAFKHTIAIAISEQHRYEEAIQSYEEVQAIAPTLPFLDHNCANALQACGRKEEAEAMYRRALAREPLDLMAHRGLNQLLWRLGRPDFLESYDTVAQLHSGNATLFVEKGRQLLLHGMDNEAMQAFERAIQIAPHDERAREGRASALTRLGRHRDAIAELESIAARWPKSPEVRLGLSECFLRAGETQRAIVAAQDALARAPNNQLALALLNTALRQQGDPQGASDYENLIEAFDLTPPDGYGDLESFHRELSAYLSRLHGVLPPPGAEGLRLIGRTSGTIFGAGTEVIASLRAHLDKAVAHHVTRLEKNGAHPFLKRRDKELRYSGSWSTRVAPGGSIANHIHDNGWISGIYFVSLPDDTGDEESTNAWLKLGEPPFDAHLAKPIERTIRPQPGRLVLFPSYLWHGSVAFQAKQPRLSVSFDAVPEASRE